uniref:Uncharacterized protein n=1 Tax=Phocoena sinus TaxID=42100 RepID=A0A8C9DWD3_PHOSS
MIQSLWKTVWRCLKKLNILLSCNPAIVLCGMYPKELKTYVYTKTCTWMFIATLFIVAKTLKQPRCPSVGKWTNKLCYIQSMEFYSVLKINELSNYEKTLRNLKMHITKCKKPIRKGYILCDSNYMTFWKR